MVVYYVGSDQPPMAVFWKDWTGNLIDFSSGWTFSLKVGTTDAATTAFTKPTGIVGATGSLTAKPQVPNLSVGWSTSGELNTLAVGIWLVQITATSTADGSFRIMQTTLEQRAALP